MSHLGIWYTEKPEDLGPGNMAWQVQGSYGLAYFLELPPPPQRPGLKGGYSFRPNPERAWETQVSLCSTHVPSATWCHLRSWLSGAGHSSVCIELT